MPEMLGHGIDYAVYSNLPSFHPVLACFCGWCSSVSCETWEQAGAELDEHLTEVKDAD